MQFNIWLTYKKKIIPVIIIFILLFAVFSGILLGIILGYISVLPPLESLNYYLPSQVSRIYDREGTKVIKELYYIEKRVKKPLSAMPANLINAVIAIEDDKFYEHIGVNPKRLMVAILIDIKRGKRAQGASTITQQLAREMFLTKKKTIVRKIKELLLALQIEKKFTKDQILEFYLNQIYYGSGAYGVQAAAKTYFSKNVEELTLSECAMIAGLPQNPSAYSPRRNITRTIKRRDSVLKRMYELNFIKEEEYKKAVSEPLKLSRSDSTLDDAPYFNEIIVRSLEKNESYGFDALFKDGIKIHSTLDYKIQKLAEEKLKAGLLSAENEWKIEKPMRYWAEQAEYKDIPLKEGDIRLAKITKIEGKKLTLELNNYTGELNLPNQLPYFKPDDVIKEKKYLDIQIDKIDDKKKTFIAELYDKTHIQGAIVVLDAHTGDVLALVGGENYYDELNNGKWNRAYLARRQPGSGFKPFVYAGAIEEGFTPGTIIVDEEVSFNTPQGIWKPENYEREYFGPTTLQEAIAFSRNVVAVKLLQTLGLKTGSEYAEKFDIAHSKPIWKLKKTELNMILGTAEVTPLELAIAYTPFVNNGIGTKPRFIIETKDRNDNIIEKFPIREKIIISPETAYIMIYMMKAVIALGTGYNPVGKYISGMNIPEIAGKTGTTNDFTDAWMNLFTPDLVIVIWLGFDTKRPMGSLMAGSVVAGPIAKEFLLEVLKTRDNWKMKFDRPENIIVLDICSKSGMLATENCVKQGAKIIHDAAFKKGTEPTSYCTLHNPNLEQVPVETQTIPQTQSTTPKPKSNDEIGIIY